MRTQLLCTFAIRSRIDDITRIIMECNDILYNKIYVFENLNDDSQLICTYNISYEDGHLTEDIPNTISLHRKKQTNTLYSINALNEVIRSLNNGVLDKKFPVPWEQYQNTLLLTNESGLNKIPTKLYQIIDTKA
tara:strand:- start:4791 stop:5192 length:402 start_codon:yes stop_codon:yes gene_type:complete